MTLFDQALRYFQVNSGGEFPDPSDPLPFHYADSIADPIVLYSTKPQLFDELNLAGFSVIGGAGIRTKKELQFLSELSNDANILFLGDCDPVDLLMFFWLQSIIDINFLALNDRILNALKCDINRITNAMSPEETGASHLVF